MRNDRKVKALRSKFGLLGYAVFNMLLEILSESEMLVIKLDETELELISGDLNIVSDELMEIIDYLIKIELLQKVNNYIFCEQLDKRSSDVFDKRKYNLDSLREINGINLSETIVKSKITPQSKVKKRKVNNNNKEERTKIIFPFDSENFIEAWNLWKQYKKEQFRFTYKSKISEQSALMQVDKYSGHDENIAIEIIKQSIANGWQGLFELKTNKNGTAKEVTANRERVARYFAETYGTDFGK